MRRKRINGKNGLQLNPKTILTEKLTEDFCKLIVEGLPPDGVCDYLGIDDSTFWMWRRRGEKFLAANGTPENHAVYAYFLQKFKRASAEYRLDRIQNLHESKKNWFRELSILERRDRKSFSRHDPAGGTLEDYDPDERFL